MATQQRQVTLGTTYYNNPINLKRFIEHNLNYVDELIVVDDGSPDPAVNHIDRHDKIKLYRVTKDYGFNSHGCRNLIMKQTSNDWVVLLDVDRQFDDAEFAFDVIKTKPLHSDVLYRFEAYKHMSYHDIHTSVNDFLIHRDHFFAAGGYDEELMGHRDGDRQYFKQLLHFGSERLLHGLTLQLTRPPSVRVAGATSPHDIRKMLPQIAKLIGDRISKPDPQKPILTFDWERVF